MSAGGGSEHGKQRHGTGTSVSLLPSASHFHLFPWPEPPMPLPWRLPRIMQTLCPVPATSCPKARVCSAKWTKPGHSPGCASTPHNTKTLIPHVAVRPYTVCLPTASLGIFPPPATGPLHTQFPGWNSLLAPMCLMDPQSLSSGPHFWRESPSDPGLPPTHCQSATRSMTGLCRSLSLPSLVFQQH